MQEVLQNVALWLLITRCGELQIDCSGSYVKKARGGYLYSLIDEKSGDPFADVVFGKNTPPHYEIWREKAKAQGRIA